MNSIHLTTYLLLTTTFAANLTECRLGVKLTGIECKSLDKSLCVFSQCELKAVQRGVTEVSVKVKLLKPVENVRVFGSVRQRAIQHRFIYELDIDGCAFLLNKRRNPMAELFYKIIELEKYSNINHSCPFEHELVLNKYRFNEQFIPILPISTGQYIANGRWSVNNVSRAEIAVNFHLFDS